MRSLTARVSKQEEDEEFMLPYSAFTAIPPMSDELPPMTDELLPMSDERAHRPSHGSYTLIALFLWRGQRTKKCHDANT